MHCETLFFTGSFYKARKFDTNALHIISPCAS